MTFLPLVLVTFLLFLFLKSDQEHIFGSEHLHYVMYSDSLVTKVNDKFSIYFSCARVKAPEILHFRKHEKWQCSSVHFSKGEDNERISRFIYIIEKNICSRYLYHCTR